MSSLNKDNKADLNNYLNLQCAMFNYSKTDDKVFVPLVENSENNDEEVFSSSLLIQITHKYSIDFINSYLERIYESFNHIFVIINREDLLQEFNDYIYEMDLNEMIETDIQNNLERWLSSYTYDKIKLFNKFLNELKHNPDDEILVLPFYIDNLDKLLDIFDKDKKIKFTIQKVVYIDENVEHEYYVIDSRQDIPDNFLCNIEEASKIYGINMSNIISLEKDCSHIKDLETGIMLVNESLANKYTECKKCNLNLETVLCKRCNRIYEMCEDCETYEGLCDECSTLEYNQKYEYYESCNFIKEVIYGYLICALLFSITSLIFN